MGGNYEAVIRKAKRFSERYETSLSRLVSEFLSPLGDTQRKPQTPMVSRLRGILPRKADVAGYGRHLERKHRR